MEEEKHTEPFILVVDDDPGQRSLLNSFLKGQGFHIEVVDSGEEALRALDRRSFSMMISDVRMPGISGLETLKRCRDRFPDLPVLLVTAYADVRDAVDAMRDGALNYLEKPIDLDELLASVQSVVGRRPSAGLSHSIDKPLPSFVIAESPAMQRVFRDASLVAQTETRILIAGESGVGKEVIAEIVHRWSGRAHAPMVKVNCAAIPENLLESELFGHEKGAFTGAVRQRIGRFEEAGGGTIFLDEIGEMPASLQAKLLRILQDGTFQRVGANAELRTDVRVLAATNRNLEKMVEEGKFREDLFYRLNVMEIYIPPLRERKEDIMPLATRFASEFVKGRPRFSSSMSACLMNYPWPGNVRELRNAMERASLLSRGELIMPHHLPNKIQKLAKSEAVPSVSAEARIEDVERAAILQALQAHQYNRTETARALGISRRNLLYKLQRYKSEGRQVDAD